MNHRKFLPFAALAGIALATIAHAQLLVYEGFDYTDVGDKLGGKGGTSDVGLVGTWADASSGPNDMFIKEGSLEFGGLPTSGNHIGFQSNLDNDRFHRQLSGAVIDEIVSLGESEGALYFSFLFEKLQNNFSADREGFALLNGVLPASRFDGSNNPGAEGRHGFAVAAVDSSNLRAIIFDGTEGTRSVSTGSVPITVVNGNSNTSISNVAVNFIVGEILFGQGTDGAHVFNLYHGTNDSIAAADLALAASIEGNFDELVINTLNLTRQVNVNYDEIRIGLSLADVAPVVTPPATTFSLVITPAVAPDTGFDLEWESQPGKLYNLHTSTDLDGLIETWALLEGGIEATPPANVKNVPEDGPRRFYAVVEFDVPPLFSKDFEDDDGGFTVAPGGTGSPWQHGEPDSEDQGGGFDVTTGNDESAQAWGVNLTGTYADDTVTALRSPAIDLSGLGEGAGAALEFALAIDIAAGASLVVQVIEEATATPIGDPVHTISGQTAADWDVLGPFPLPSEAIGEIVRIEWLFTGPDGSLPFLGAYLDDVTVTETSP